ncbi:Uncharacterised protein [Bordetella pertussis]|nr:Uncharacterised protein [Bordetella pertussis]
MARLAKSSARSHSCAWADCLERSMHARKSRLCRLSAASSVMAGPSSLSLISLPTSLAKAGV